MPIEETSNCDAEESERRPAIPRPNADAAKPGTGNRQRIEVAAGLLFREGKLLIAQRDAEDHLGGLWEFPGGKRHPGESFEQCLARELCEELGVSVSVGKLFESLTHEYPDLSVLLKFFLCRLNAGEPQPLGCAALKWVSQTELAAHEFPAADARLLRRLRNSPSLWL
jgi:8-oxo-dGTP diphosphatase